MGRKKKINYIKDVKGNETMYQTSTYGKVSDAATIIVFRMIEREVDFRIVTEWIAKNIDYVQLSVIWRKINDKMSVIH